MAPARINDTHMDRSAMDRSSGKERYMPGENGDRTYGDRMDDSRDGRKRKGHEHYDHETPPKRMKGRSPSPRGAGDRRRDDHDRWDRAPPSRDTRPPVRPRAFDNGPRHERRGGGHRDGRAEYDGDRMEGVQATSKGPPVPTNPLTRTSAAWIPDIDVEEDDDLLKEVQSVMGFAGFKSTNNRQVPGNSRNYGIKKAQETQYRQYMNRVGGFNRPLSPPKD